MNKKIISLIIILLAIYTIIMLVIFKKDVFKKEEPVYVVLDNYENYEYKNGTFKSLSNKDLEDLEKIYNVYIDEKNIGKYYLKYGEIWNLFDENHNYKSHDKEFIAISDTSRISINNGIIRNLNDSEKELLSKEYKIQNFDNIVQKVYELDLNNDDKTDKIIYVSNYDDENYNNNFNLIVAFVKNKKYNIINNKKKNEIYYLNAILDIKSENRKYLVIRENINPDGDVKSNKIEYNIYDFDKKIK